MMAKLSDTVKVRLCEGAKGGRSVFKDVEMSIEQAREEYSEEYHHPKIGRDDDGGWEFFIHYHDRIRRARKRFDSEKEAEDYLCRYILYTAQTHVGLWVVQPNDPPLDEDGGLT